MSKQKFVGSELNLEKFEDGTREAWKSFSLACRELEMALEGKKPITDKTKLAAVTMGAYAKLKGAEVHRMAMEIMIRRKLIGGNVEIPSLPEPR